MNLSRLIALEVRNLRTFSIIIATTIVAYLLYLNPTETLFGAFGSIDRGPWILLIPGLVLTFLLAWTFAYLFGGSSSVVKREHNVYDRYFAFPTSPWRVLFAEMLGTAVPSFAFAAVALILLVVRATNVPLALLGALVPALAVFVIGASALVFAVTLYFENPRAPTVAFFAGVATVIFGIPQLMHLIQRPSFVAVTVATVLVGLSLASVLALAQVTPRHVLS